MQIIDKCVIDTATPLEKIKSNIEESKIRIIPKLDCLEELRRDVPVAIVGGGPSLKDNLELLRTYKYIMACGSVHDYLVENGIIPTWCVICDPDPVVINYLQRWNLSVKYLIASQCDRSVFEYLRPSNYYMWHAYGDKLGKEFFGENEILIPGGCTVGTRAMMMAFQFGFSTQHLFGFDTCLTNEYKHHAYDFSTAQETVGDITEIKLDPEGETFKVAGYMLAQFFDFRQILDAYAHRLDVTIHGEGLLKSFMNICRQKALDQLKEKQNGDC